MGRISTAIAASAKNSLINGDMRLAQRGGTVTSPVNATYLLDRWQYSKSGAMVHTVTQETDVPTLAQAGSLFQNSMKLTVTTADSSITAAKYCNIAQKIEGYNFVAIAQKTMTLSFWVKSSVAGISAVSIHNSVIDRSYVSEYTVNAVNTWEKKIVTFTASPPDGTWNYSTGIGLYVLWSLASGSNQSTTAGVWQSAAVFSTSSMVNHVGTVGNSFFITGVMLNEGQVAAPFRLFGNDIGGELLACQRYCYAINNNSVNIVAISSAFTAHSTTAASGVITMPVNMRTVPTVSTLTGAAADFRLTDNSSSWATNTLPVVGGTNNSSTREITVVITTLTAVLIQFRSYFFGFSNLTLNSVIFSAEL